MRENLSSFMGEFINLWQSHTSIQQAADASSGDDQMVHQFVKLLGPQMSSMFKEDSLGNVKLWGINLSSVYNFLVFITIPLSIAIKVMVFLYTFFKGRKIQILQEEKLNAEINLINHADEMLTTHQTNVVSLAKEIKETPSGESIELAETVAENIPLTLDEGTCDILKRQKICSGEACDVCVVNPRKKEDKPTE